MMLDRPPSKGRGTTGFRRLQSRGRWLAIALGASLPVLPAPDAAAVTGVCADGSVFIVQRAADIPCKNARRVDPHEVPPMRPENLPRSYLWEVYRQKQNENNPYNLVERAEQVRKNLAKGGSPPPETLTLDGNAGGGATPSPQPLPQVASAPPPAPPAPADLGLTDGELRDLFLLVELSQEHAPATFATEQGGSEALRVSFAHSAAFEARVRDAIRVDGPVLLFSVQPQQAESFRPNFTFVQGANAFHPQPGDARQLDLLVGEMGALAPGDLVLGYAVLPGDVALSKPIDVYWDDRRIAVQFR